MSRGSQTVEILVRADHAQAKAFAAALAGGFDKAGDAVERMGKKGGTGFRSLASDADKFILKLVGVQSAADLAMKAITAALNKQVELRQASVAPAVARDTGIRNYLKTQGMKVASSYAPVEKLFHGVGHDLAVPFQDVSTIAEAMGSANVSHEAIAGGGLHSTVAGWLAMNQVGGAVDPSAHGKAMGLMMSSMGLQSNAENIARANRVLFSAKSQGNVEISDLPAVAGRMGTVRQFGGLSFEEYMASLSMLSRRGGTDEMSTSFKNVVQGMTQFGNVPSKVKALQSMNIKPTDVDMVGETFFDAIGKIKGGVDKLPPEKRMKVLGQLWGERTIQAIPGFFEGMGEISEIGQGLNDKEGFAAAVGIGSQGPAARARRAQLANEKADSLGGFEAEMGYQEREAQRKKDLAAGENMGLPGFQTMNYMVYEMFDRMTASLRENTEALKAEREATQRNTEKMGEGVRVEFKEPIEAKSGQPARGREGPGVWERLKAGFEMPRPSRSRNATTTHGPTGGCKCVSASAVASSTAPSCRTSRPLVPCTPCARTMQDSTANPKSPSASAAGRLIFRSSSTAALRRPS